MKKIVLGFIIGVLITAVILGGLYYFQNRETSVSEIPNDDAICGQGSCIPANSSYGTDVGDTIENYELTDFDGNKVNLYDLMDGYDKVVIALEADWCSDCHRQDEKMIQDGAIPDNVLYIPVFTTYSKEDDPEKTATYDTAKEYAVDKYESIGITPYFDVDDKLWNDFDAVGTPTNISIDANGRIKLISLEVDADTIFLENSEDKPRTLE